MCTLMPPRKALPVGVGWQARSYPAQGSNRAIGEGSTEICPAINNTVV